MMYTLEITNMYNVYTFASALKPFQAFIRTYGFFFIIVNANRKVEPGRTPLRIWEK